MRREASNEPVVHFVKATSAPFWMANTIVRCAAMIAGASGSGIVCRGQLQPRADLSLQGKDRRRNARIGSGRVVEPNNPLLRMFRAIRCITVAVRRGVRPSARSAAQNPNLHGVRPFLAMCLSARGEHEAARAELNEDVKRNAAVDPDIATRCVGLCAEGNASHGVRVVAAFRRLGNGTSHCSSTIRNPGVTARDERLGN